MGIEIERKFLVIGDGWRRGAKGVLYRQGYLNDAGGVTVRVRVAGDRGWLCVKGPTEGITRAEFDYPIPLADAEAMLRLCPRPPVEKTRTEVMHGGRRWEVDEFHGTNAGLIVAEVELDDAAAEVEIPDWAGKDVSADRRYSNASLARRPFSEWDSPEPSGPASE